MPRRLRCSTGNYIYHALNRAVGRATLFRKQADYAAFVRILAEAKEWQAMRLLGYCLMPNHWHLVLWPHGDGDLESLRRSVLRGSPFGEASWVEQTAAILGLESTLRPRGRPRKEVSEE